MTMQMMCFKTPLLKFIKVLIILKEIVNFILGCIVLQQTKLLHYINKNAKRLQITNEEAKDLAINNMESDVYFEGDAIQLKLQKAIATLPEKQQLVFNMKYFQDIKYKEMSEILETSEGALKASYHIATKKIEAYLTNN